jgi:hypothetical protein
MRSPVLAVIGTLLAISAIPVPASADPVTVAGTVFLFNNGAGFQRQPSIKFYLFGPRGSMIAAGWNERESWILYPGGISVQRDPTTAAGDAYNLSTHVSFVAGSGFTDRFGYYIPIDADLTFQAGTGILRTFDDGTPVGTDLIAEAPARFFGTIRGFDPDTHALLFEEQILSRRGSARVLLSTADPAVFDFVYGAETPEPGTVILMATGFGFLMLVVRRRGSASPL